MSSSPAYEHTHRPGPAVWAAKTPSPLGPAGCTVTRSSRTRVLHARGSARASCRPEALYQPQCDRLQRVPAPACAIGLAQRCNGCGLPRLRLRLRRLRRLRLRRESTRGPRGRPSGAPQAAITKGGRQRTPHSRTTWRVPRQIFSSVQLCPTARRPSPCICKMAVKGWL